MKKPKVTEKVQIVALHGGTVFKTRREYLLSLHTRPLTLEALRAQDWKARLGDTLGVGFDVILPQMPHNKNARYKEWKIWFERIIPLLSDGVILIGHSLGGIFLAQYLSENTCPKKIRATMLVAAPFVVAPNKQLVDFRLPADMSDFTRQGGQIFVYHSQDDHIVPYCCGERYADKLPNVHFRPHIDRQHFNQKEFPEIVRDILGLFSE